MKSTTSTSSSKISFTLDIYDGTAVTSKTYSIANSGLGSSYFNIIRGMFVFHGDICIILANNDYAYIYKLGERQPLYYSGTYWTGTDNKFYV